MAEPATDLVIRSRRLEATVSPAFGGSVTSARLDGVEILWRTAWADDTPPPPRDEPLDVVSWVRHSRGGWQVLLPNGGDDCEWRGTRHGFHGEASVIPWTVSAVAHDSVTLTAELTAVPLDVERTIVVDGTDLRVQERLSNRSAQPVEFIWTHHPGFGGDLLDGPVTMGTNARSVRLDDRAPAIGTDARPGDTRVWPLAALQHPSHGNALLGYLVDFDGPPWVSLVRDDGSLGVRVTWDGATFPCCWIWQELGGTTGAPWEGAVTVIGIEPSTSWPGQGLARVAATTGTTRSLEGRESTSTAVTVSVSAGDHTNSLDGDAP